MPELSHFRLVVTGPARRDIASSLRWSLRNFGEAASLRYKTLIDQALRDIQSDPERPGTKPLPELTIDGVRLYHISLSRSRTPPPAVKSPRHFILYRIAGPGMIEVARVLHDSRSLDLHLPAAYRT